MRETLVTMHTPSRWTSFALALAAAGCGARSPLRGELADASGANDVRIDSPTDAPTDGPVEVARPDDACLPRPEVCNGLDDDCDGTVDDLFVTCGAGECRLRQPACTPEGQMRGCVPGPPSPERCDGLDNDCDGVVDNGFGPVTCGVGACMRTVPTCAMGAPMVCAPAPPSPETCNGRDDDCNGVVDDYDPGGDGIFDCIDIALVGNSGGYEASDFVAWLRTRGVTVRRIQTTVAPLTDAELAPYEVVVLDRLVRAYSAEEALVLRRWVEAGGGVFAMSGYTNTDPDRDYPNSLVRPMGVAFIDGLLNEQVTTFAPHPLNAGLTSVPFIGGFRVTAAAPGSVYTARLPEGPVGGAVEVGRGRVYLWGDEWIEFDSEWRTMPMVTRFWANTFEWLSHAR